MAWRAFIGFGLWAAALTPAAAQDDLAAALALPMASELVGAREAPRFAWVETAAGLRNIWVAGPGEAARRVTAYSEDDGQLVYDLTFSRDGRRLAFVRGGDEEFPDEEDLPNTGSASQPPRQQLFVLAVAGGAPDFVGEGHSPAFAPDGERIAFTRRGAIWLKEPGREARRIAVVTGEVTGLSWSPDGGRLAFVDNRKDHSFVALLDPAEGQLTYAGAGLDFAVEPVFSPDGRQLAFIRYREPPPGTGPDSGPYWSLRVADTQTGASHELWAAPAGTGSRYYGTRSRNLFWSADGRIVFPWERSGWVHPYAIDAGKGGAPRELTPGAFEVESFLLGADGRSIVYAANAGDIDRRHLWRVSLAGGAPVRLSSGSGIESAPAIGGGKLAAMAMDVSHLAHPVLVEKSLSPLGKDPALARYVAPEQVVFRAADGVEVHGQLFRARGAGRHPALIFVHGGPRRQMLLGLHTSGYYSNAYILNQHFTAEGYDVLAVNYRSGTGYGLAFRDAAEIGREGGSEYRDVLAAGRWLAARGEVDPARIGIWGGSWGGYLTALALARDSALFAAGVDFHGVHSLLRPVANSLSPDAQAAARQVQWSASPVADIARWRSPVLLIHGDDDRNVDFAQSLLLARELAARRVPFRELVFPNERHSFFRYADWLKSYRATDAFFAETLKGKEPARQ